MIPQTIDISNIEYYHASYVGKKGALRFNEVGREKASKRYSKVIERVEAYPDFCELREKITRFDNAFSPALSFDKIKEFNIEITGTDGYNRLCWRLLDDEKELGLFYRRQIDSLVLFYVLQCLNNKIPNQHSCYYTINEAFRFLNNYFPAKYGREEYDSFNGFLTMFSEYKKQVKDLAIAMGIDTRSESEIRADRWKARKRNIEDILGDIALAFIFVIIGVIVSKCNG